MKFKVLISSCSHNSIVLELFFNGGAISEKAPVEFRMHIEDMRYSFSLLNYDLKSINSKTEDNNSLDSVRVKAVVYALYSGNERPSFINKVVKMDVSKPPVVKEIENTLEALQAEVGGLIECVYLDDRCRMI